MTLLAAFPARAAWAVVDGQGLERIGPAGHVDWVFKKAVATGQGFPPARILEPERRRQFARRAAVLDARRNLLEVLQGVRLQGRTVLRERAAASDVVRAEVDGLLAYSVIEALEDQPDGSAQARVSVELRLVGLDWLASPGAPAAPDAQLPGALRGEVELPSLPVLPEPAFQPPEPQATGVAPFVLPEIRGPVRREFPGESTESIPVSPPSPPQETPLPPGMPSGIVIDARGAGFEPSLAPSLHDDAGEIYPADLLTPETISTAGIVRYYRESFPAMASPAAGETPLTLRALQTLPGRPDALRLQPEDAARLRGLAHAPGSPLSRGRVIIIF